MKAVTISHPGPPDVLTLQEVAEPSVGPRDVLIDVDATALNGNYPPPADAPPYPGLECAGVILSVGDEVTGWQPGDRVMALLGGGGYAERVAIPANQLMPVPRTLTLREAAAIPEAWLTAYSNMVEIGRLSAGEKVLIHAGASGVGSAAIQIAKQRKAFVATTVSAAKIEAVRNGGADLIIDYGAENFADRIGAEIGGVDLIVDFIGAPYWQDNLRALKLWGRLVLVGLMGGRQVDFDLGMMLRKKLSLHGSTLRDRTNAQKASLIERFVVDLLPGFDDGTLHPVLDDSLFTLETIVDAHRHMEANRNIGKIVVTIRHDTAPRPL